VAGNPRGNGLFSVYRKRTVCKDWMVEVIGLKLATHHPVTEPVSTPSRERKFPMQRRGRKGRLYHLAETNPETPRGAKSPHSGANWPGPFFAARSWAGCTTNMFGFDLRQAQVGQFEASWLGSLGRLGWDIEPYLVH
jgi:hypothetical protein